MYVTFLLISIHRHWNLFKRLPNGLITVWFKPKSKSQEQNCISSNKWNFRFKISKLWMFLKETWVNVIFKFFFTVCTSYIQNEAMLHWFFILESGTNLLHSKTVQEFIHDNACMEVVFFKHMCSQYHVQNSSSIWCRLSNRNHSLEIVFKLYLT